MQVRIVIDERERSSKIPNLLRQMGITIDFASLAVGDYIVSPETAIERKTINDLLASIYDGRLYVQCSDLIQHYSRPVVVIEGNIRDLEDLHNIRDDDQFRIVLDRIQISYDALAKIALDFRIPIIHSPSAEYSSRLLLTMARRSMEEGHSIGPFLKKIKKNNPLYLQQLFVLSSLPSIGNKLAARMLKKFNTPQRALNASIAELASIPGFGTARAVRVRKILDCSENDKIDLLTQRTLLDDQNSSQ
ncbi:MAG TPA: ERCC4 domain-containing protein [Nitrososphaeraceae archaeon]|nr:ERCC4 domain-containing protein [Nitrososphaeraceae archaeon]